MPSLERTKASPAVAGQRPDRESVRWSADLGQVFWDHTQLRSPRREGMRIDFVLGSPALAARTTGARIDREERKGKGASDHAPVIVDLAD